MFKPLDLKTIVRNQMLMHMALIKTGGGVAAISGKTGGTVYGRNKAGAYQRNWAKPVNPGTARQTDVRSNFAGGSAAFSKLAAANVAAWNAYAAVLIRTNRQGDAYTPTGRQIYIEQYNNMTAIGATPLVAPSIWNNVPAIAIPGAIVAEADTGEVGTLSLGITTVVIPSGDAGVMIIEAAPAHKASLTNVNTQFRQIFSGAPTALMNFTTGYIATFGNSLTTGQVVSIRLRVVDGDSGLGSTRILLNTPATAA